MAATTENAWESGKETGKKPQTRALIREKRERDRLRQQKYRASLPSKKKKSGKTRNDATKEEMKRNKSTLRCHHLKLEIKQPAALQPLHPLVYLGQ